uniref:complement resistance protein TraT n=2 Tax=Cysteiniphilum TaxID=2056696 RepID=UPI001F296E24
KSDWLRYRTRIVSVANQVNLKFEEAKPELQAQIAKQVSGILGGISLTKPLLLKRFTAIRYI